MELALIIGRDRQYTKYTYQVVIYIFNKNKGDRASIYFLVLLRRISLYGIEVAVLRTVELPTHIDSVQTFVLKL